MAEEYLKGRKILILFICVLQTCISLGVVFGYSVMYAELVNVFSTSRTKAALIQGIFIFITLGGGNFFIKLLFEISCVVTSVYKSAKSARQPSLTNINLWIHLIISQIK